MGLIRLVITVWKRDGEKEGREGTMRERKHVEEDGKQMWTKTKYDRGANVTEGGLMTSEEFGLSYLLKRGRGAKRASASLPHTCL